jgi:hypothetical protein
MEEYQRKIQAEARRRGIQRLYHFTPIDNLGSILTHGLVSRQVLKQNGIPFAHTDGWLEDGTDCVSASIHSLNLAMFDRKKRERGGWAVVGIDASVLWTHGCRFAWTNSASSEIRNQRGFRGGPHAFGMMFQDRPVNAADGRSMRAVLRRGDHQPTENDAEVEVVHLISPELILHVIVGGASHKEAVEAFMAENGMTKPVLIEVNLFS